MIKNCLNISCLTFLLLTFVLGDIACSQEAGWDNWNDLGGFEDFPAFDDTGESKDTKATDKPPVIDLPVPTDNDVKAENELLKIDSEASKLTIQVPDKFSDIDLPTQKATSDIKKEPIIEDSKTKEATQKTKTSKKETVKTATKKKKSETKKQASTKKSSGKSKIKEVVLKDGNKSTKQVINNNRRHVQDDIKVNSKLSNLLGRDVDLEETYSTSPDQFTRTDYNYKAKPHQFFIDHRNEANAHIPRVVYQKEYSQLLFSAIEKEDIGALKALINNGADINSKIIATGYSATMHAVKKSKIRALRYLVTRGANLTLQDNSGKTPLHLAISEGKVTIFNILIAAGADPFIKDHAGKYPVDYATKVLKSTFNTSIARVSQNKNKALLEFSDKGSIHAVAELLGSGALVDSKDKQGNTPLIRAIKKSDLRMVQYLLSQGANPLVMNNMGMDALQVARGSSHHRIYSIIDTVVIRAELESGISRQAPEPAAVTTTTLGALPKNNPVIELIAPVPLPKVTKGDNYLTAFDIMESSGEHHEGFFESLFGNLDIQSAGEPEKLKFEKIQEIKPGLLKKTAKKTEYVETLIFEETPEVMKKFNRFINAFSFSDKALLPASSTSNNTSITTKEYSSTIDLIPDEIQ